MERKAITSDSPMSAMESPPAHFATENPHRVDANPGFPRARPGFVDAGLDSLDPGDTKLDGARLESETTGPAPQFVEGGNGDARDNRDACGVAEPSDVPARTIPVVEMSIENRVSFSSSRFAVGWLLLATCLLSASFLLSASPLAMPENRDPTPDAQHVSGADGKPSREPFPHLKIDINTVSEQELNSLPGIGPKLARSIVEYRRNVGPINHPEELVRIPGLGKKLSAELQSMVDWPVPSAASLITFEVPPPSD